jgi:dynein heavy chain, axonemal
MSVEQAAAARMQGNLLDDTELIDVLATTKQTSQDVAEKLANASETNAKINEACEEFRPVAHRATLVYFLIAEFSVVNCMYQTSLAQFTELYEQSIDHSDKATLPSKRIHNIIECAPPPLSALSQPACAAISTAYCVLLFAY